jgi:Ala-tRNA(Pro) deacylase
MSCLDELIVMLEAESVPYRLSGHPPTFTAQDEASAEHLPAQRVAKVVIAMVDEAPVMAVIGADQRVDLSAVARAAGGKRARLAREEEFVSLFPDCDVGAMPPFGNVYGLVVVVDRPLLQESHLTFLAGTHDQSMTIPTGAYDRLAHPILAPLAKRAETAGAA